MNLRAFFWASRWPCLVLCVGCVLQIGAILWLNGGRFIYSLDDPYIHLAVAENIARGHYGVNLQEVSAPSSSLLWPFLLAPFARLSWGELAPLGFNFAATLAIVALTFRIATHALDDLWRANVVTIALIFACNLIGLIFTGMEHCLQVLAAMLVLHELIFWNQARGATIWLFIALVCGPLLRYENLVWTIPVACVLWRRGERRAALWTSTLVFVSLAGFSVWLRAHDLGWLPSSIVAKSGEKAFVGPLGTLLTNLQTPAALLLLTWSICLLLVAWRSRREQHEREVCAVVATAIVGHLLGGHFGWFGRYEIYIWLPAILTCLWSARAWLQSAAKQFSRPRIALAALFFVLTAGLEYLQVTLKTPLACRNIYEQQWQMHRFLTQWHRAPVAVVDLGWTAFRNDEYVLDLWGLGSRQALQWRLKSRDHDWMQGLARQKKARLAIIAPQWLPPPTSWRLLATLHLSGASITTQSTSVSFYATDDAASSHLKKQLRAWNRTLPRGVHLQWN